MRMLRQDSEKHDSILRAAPPGRETVPDFDDGWRNGDGDVAPYLSYAQETSATNWSEELDDLHAEVTRTHFLDVWTRAAIGEELVDLDANATIVDLGCGSGYLLDDLRSVHVDATFIGIDLVASGLVKAHALVPGARLIQADVCDLPLADESVDAIVSANLLEHIPDDRRALSEIYRVLKPGAPAVLVVPSGRDTYDYYDRFLGHERRYGRRELADKAGDAGLEVVVDRYLASLLYLPFWLVKQRNRRRYADLEGAELERRVTADIASTSDSRVGTTVRRVEERLRLRLSFGIRNLVALRRPAE